MSQQPSLPPPQPQPTPPPHPPPPSHPPTDSLRVRCAGCRMILTVAPGLTEFACPTCRMPQMLPLELMARAHHTTPPNPPQTTSHPPLLLPPPPSASSSSSHVPAHGIDPTKIQLPCAKCKAILNVPHGLARFACPQCGIELAVDVSKVKQFFPPEEVNEAFCELEIVTPGADEGGEWSPVHEARARNGSWQASRRRGT